MRLIMVRLALRSCMLELSAMFNSSGGMGLPNRIMVRLNIPGCFPSPAVMHTGTTGAFVS